VKEAVVPEVAGLAEEQVLDPAGEREIARPTFRFDIVGGTCGCGRRVRPRHFRRERAHDARADAGSGATCNHLDASGREAAGCGSSAPDQRE
jgi:hypothetical protein